ncbi:hypothetical protein Dvina_30155 [Dactylosporangium vinaceum]|uniref:Lipoprotein n=1 Tax=Dactylosporangium vinaceum TaxID=53362 RepID=A0ABV5LZD0_9ACTN|nr:hypothetical protein [Dactylosporangium vinaceum]UAB92598.1 hypothetical protein Dvina_30155 [Dactylosporangium vinaceum]
MRGALIVVAALLLAACDDPATSTGPAAGPPSPSPSVVTYASARDELAAGLDRTAATTSTYAVQVVEDATKQVQGVMSGVSDPARKASSGRSEPSRGVGVTVVEITVIGDDLWSRTGPPDRQWTHMQLSRAPLAAALGFTGIVASVGSAGPALADVRRGGPRSFTGTLDPARAGPTAVIHNAKAQPFPFEATLDEQGYVTTLVLHPAPTIAGMKPATTTVKLSGFGRPVTIAAPPAAEVKEIAEDAYQLYGGR